MNDPRFKKTLLITTAVHFAVVLVLIIFPLLTRLLRPPKKPEMITFIDLQAMPPAPPPPQPRPEPPQPRPEPKIEEPKPSPIPEKPPDKPKPPEPPKIKVNTNRVVRKVEDQPKPAPQQPQLTQEQIRKLLEANIKFSSSGTPSANFSDLSLYYATVRDAMYGAWTQPSAAARGLRAEASIRVQRNGTVTQRRLSRSSGSKLMDDSVLAAVNAVARLRPLPADVRDAHLDITIEFVVGE
ncbi:MAG TPA: TonB family protein [Kiritimatiellia bacterium]|nr:TonB family protein [Kiritimatiellia bacterium]